MYKLSDRQQQALDNNFKYHAPKDGQQDRYVAVRDAAREFATVLMALCPESRELSVAMTELETAVMWANAAIARNE
jgi:hypothetical protein